MLLNRQNVNDPRCFDNAKSANVGYAKDLEMGKYPNMENNAGNAYTDSMMPNYPMNSKMMGMEMDMGYKTECCMPCKTECMMAPICECPVEKCVHKTILHEVPHDCIKSETY